MKNLGLVKDRINDIAKSDLSKIKAGGADAGSKSSTESIQQNTKAIQDQSKAMNTQSGKYYPALINEVDKYRKRNDDLSKTIRDLSAKNEEIKKRISGLTTVYQQSGKAALDAKSKYEEFLTTNPNLFASRLGPQ